MMLTHQQTQPATARHVMTDNPACVLPSDTVDQVAQLMRREDVGPILVVDDRQNRRLLGIVTDRDLALKVVAEWRDPRRTTVEAIMSSNPVTVDLQADLPQVLRLMAEHQVRRIPVVDDQGRLLGIIAQADIATRVAAPRQTAAVVEQISRPEGSARAWHIPKMPADTRMRRSDRDDIARLIGGLALGAALMYLLDPDRGDRRRKLLLEQVSGVLSQSDSALGKRGRDLRNRAHGLMAEASARLSGEQVDDVILVQRVRSAMGRVVSHPRAIEVTAEHGRVTLRGPILTREVDRLLSTVSRVRGVTDIDNQLEGHQQAGDVAGLQGDTAQPDQHSELMQQSWASASRLLTSAAGAGLAVFGAGRGDFLGLGLGTLGLGLLARGLIKSEPQQLVGADHQRVIDVHKTITVNAPVDEVFCFWRDFDNFPRFMDGLKEVRDWGSGRSHWVAAGPAGMPIAWDAKMMQSEPNHLIVWQSVPGALVANAGVIRFEPLGDARTRVNIRLSYNPPAGALGHAAATLFGADPDSPMDSDLVRLKLLFEHSKASGDTQTASREQSDPDAALREREVGAASPGA